MNEIKARQSPGPPSAGRSLFSKDEHTGQQTPSVVLKASRPKPARRRSSGLGIDQEGYGSPSVTQLLDRRSSIGESAPRFELDRKQKGLRFEDPKKLEQEIDAERAEEERRESGRFVMEQEANGLQQENATFHLQAERDEKSCCRCRKRLAWEATC